MFKLRDLPTKLHPKSLYVIKIRQQAQNNPNVYGTRELFYSKKVQTK